MKRINIWFRPLLILTAFFIFLLFYQQLTFMHSDERAIIGTFVRVDVCVPNSRRAEVSAALNRVWGRFEEIEKRMNAYDSDSDIGRINNADGEFVKVHHDVYSLIASAIDFNAVSQGAFDITMMPLIERWNRAEELNRMPSPEEIAVIQQKTGVDRIRMKQENENFYVACDECEIDLGGIAKGYALDQAADILKGEDFSNFLINAGGDMLASGQSCRGDSWRVGIQHPKDQDEIVDIIEITDQAVTTSGDYEQYFVIDDQHFSHIIDPVTGFPQRGIVSATVIAPTATEADVFSTALTVRNPAKGIQFIDQLGEGYGALVIEANLDNDLMNYSSRNYDHLSSK